MADYLERYALQWDLPVRIFTKIDVTSRTAATAFAYDHELL